MKWLLFLLLPFTVSAQISTIDVGLRFVTLVDGKQGIYRYDALSTAENGYDSIAFQTGRLMRLNMANMIQYDLYTTPIVVTSTSTIACNALVTDINVNASSNITITLSPWYTKQVINVKRMDNSNNVVTLQMNSGNIEGVSTLVMDNVQNMNYQLRWDGTANTTTIR